MKARLAILASGGGTTAEACIRASIAQDLNFRVALVIVSREQAGIFDRIAGLNQELGLHITSQLINHHTHPAQPGEVVPKGCQTAAEQQAIMAAIETAHCDLVVLMGYMKRVGEQVVQRLGWQNGYTSPYQAQMLNTHPGLLPDTKGLYGALAQQQVLDKHLAVAGQTLHVVAEDYDDGPVIAEHRVAVLAADTADSLFARVQQVEKHYLPLDIAQFITDQQTYKETA